VPQWLHGTVTVTARESIHSIAISYLQGHADGQFHFGRCLEDAVGVEKDPQLAIRWFQYGSARVPLECDALGLPLHSAAQPCVHALCRKAAEQGHAEAQFQLASALERVRSL
jgi:TPR repeat protein